jgi:tetratricopeptide (TPR) repeat protein
MSAGTLTASEASQLAQTIEMFEVITQSQPYDCQSLEVLKEAYAKLGREPDVVRTSKRLAQAYVAMGQLSSAILEYESILQNHPDDPDVLAALGDIESKANNLSAPAAPPAPGDPAKAPAPPATSKAGAAVPVPKEFDDGKLAMKKLFVDGRLITQEDFDKYWIRPDMSRPPDKVVEPFIQILADKQAVLIDKSLKLLSDKARLAYLPLERYDLDFELAHTFPSATCRRWCVFPFDRMSKSVLVATANPFNKQAVYELEQATKYRVLFYLAAPLEIMKAIRKTHR